MATGNNNSIADGSQSNNNSFLGYLGNGAKKVGAGIANTVLPIDAWKHVVTRAQEDAAKGINPYTDPGYYKTSASAIAQPALMLAGGLFGGGAKAIIGGKLGKTIWGTVGGMNIYDQFNPEKPAPQQVYGGDAYHLSTIGTGGKPAPIINAITGKVETQTQADMYTAAKTAEDKKAADIKAAQDLFKGYGISMNTGLTPAQSEYQKAQAGIAGSALKSAVGQSQNAIRLSNAAGARDIEGLNQAYTGGMLDAAGLGADLGQGWSPASDIGNQISLENARRLGTQGVTSNVASNIADALANIANAKISNRNTIAGLNFQGADQVQNNYIAMAQQLGLTPEELKRASQAAALGQMGGNK